MYSVYNRSCRHDFLTVYINMTPRYSHFMGFSVEAVYRIMQVVEHLSNKGDECPESKQCKTLAVTDYISNSVWAKIGMDLTFRSLPVI